MSRFSSTTKSPERSGSNEARARSIRSIVRRRWSAIGVAASCSLGEHRLDLRMGAISGDRRGLSPRAIGRRQRAVDIHVAEAALADRAPAPCSPSSRADRLADRRRRSARIDPRRAGHPCAALPLGNVLPAMVGGQRRPHNRSRCGRAGGRNRRGRGRARTAAGTSPRPRCHSCGRHSRSPTRPIDEHVGRRPRPSFISSISAAASASVAPSNSGEARKARSIAGLAREAAGADRLARRPRRQRRAPWPGTARAAPARAAAAAIAAATAALAAATARGTARPPRSVTNVLPSQYQRWSTALAAHHHRRAVLARDRDVAAAGLRRFSRSPSVGTRR